MVNNVSRKSLAIIVLVGKMFTINNKIDWKRPTRKSLNDE